LSGNRKSQQQKMEREMERKQKVVEKKERTIADIEADIAETDTVTTDKRLEALRIERGELANKLREENLRKGEEKERARAKAWRAAH
jgi:hypothetical protein